MESYEIRALLASVLVGLSCGVLGCFIVLRNMAQIGDALSHAILPGVVGAFVLAGHSLAAFFGGAVVAGFTAALIITWLQRRVKTKNDAVIGIVFSAMFALGLIALARVTRQEGVHLDLKDFLFGNILGVSTADLYLTGILCVFVVGSIALFYRYWFLSTFSTVMASVMGISTGLLHYYLMLLISLTVVAALQSVGVILVVSMLVIPGSAAHLLAKRLPVMLILAAIIGVVSACGGLALAILFNTPPGPTMTVVASFIYGGAVLWSIRK
jgi:ABC-type Mn2+/Zn2+ transport system permease subunit